MTAHDKTSGTPPGPSIAAPLSAPLPQPGSSPSIPNPRPRPENTVPPSSYHRDNWLLAITALGLSPEGRKCQYAFQNLGDEEGFADERLFIA